MQSSQAQHQPAARIAASSQQQGSILEPEAEIRQQTAITTATPSTSNSSGASNSTSALPSEQLLLVSQVGETPTTSFGAQEQQSRKQHLENSSSLAGSRQSGAKFDPVSEQQQNLVVQQQQNKPDHRIKVTLSAPRTEQETIESFQAEETKQRVWRESAEAKRRQSTATLISAVGTTQGSQRDLSQLQQQQEQEEEEQEQQQPNQKQVALSRLERESELRRIASQRQRKSLAPGKKIEAPPTSQVASGGELKLSPLMTNSANNDNNNKQPQSSSKQLAIYINGKIRSNSIFCRSSSNNSFNSILNRFHSHNNSSANNEGQDNSSSNNNNNIHIQANQLQLINNKDSPLRLCNSQQQKQRQRRIIRCSKRSASEKQSLVSNFSSGARKLFSNYLPKQAPRTKLQKVNETDKEEEEEGEESEGEDKRRELCDKALPVTSKGSVSSTRSQRQENCGQQNQDQQETGKASYKLNPSSMFLRKAMRYYRLWIYCTNVTILVGTLIFILSALYVASDYRIRLLITAGKQSLIVNEEHDNVRGNEQQQQDQANQQQDNNSERQTVNHQLQQGLNNNNDQQQQLLLRDNIWGPKSLGGSEEHQFSISYSEPSVLLAYAAIAIQAGLLQAIGCFGAIQMKERWIQTFWYLILALTVFDVVFLVYWLNRYDFMAKTLRHQMTFRLNQHYGNSSSTSTNFSSTISLRQFQQQQEHPIGTKLDKILTEIIDKIQLESQCCGISSSLDYKQSRWRRLKLEELRLRLNWSEPNLVELMRKVPLVPATCCLRSSQPKQIPNAPSGSGKQVILDDSELERAARIPAWSPSMVVEQLGRRSNLAGGKSAPEVGDGAGELEAEKGGQEVLSLGDLVDRRWSSTGISGSGEDHIDLDQDLDRLSLSQRRRLAKQDNYNQQQQIGEQQQQQPQQSFSAKRRRRWVEESRVDEQLQVLTRLVSVEAEEGAREEGEAKDTGSEAGYGEQRVCSGLRNSGDGCGRTENSINQRPTGSGGSGGGRGGLDREEETKERPERPERPYLSAPINAAEAPGAGSRAAMGAPGESRGADNRGALLKLAGLRRALFRSNGNSSGEVGALGGVQFGPSNFRQPNKLQLSFQQYKLIEGYLLGIGGASVELAARLRRSIHSSLTGNDGQVLAPTTADDDEDEERQNPVSEKGNVGPDVLDQARKRRADEHQEAASIRRRLLELSEAIRLDPETSCAPRSYYDQASIHTNGCQPAIKAWLDSSAHILFVTGFCVLTVLKFCSLVLLRLEIREMIHKIKVLKGMATEYNALHDLEAYLPRPSLCAQAAELTPSGVTAALSNPAAGGEPAPRPGGHANGATLGGHRIGGSFSEAVVAATQAAAASQAGSQSLGAGNCAQAAAASSSPQLGLGGLASSGRAASMKAMAAVSSMLAPSFCPPRSSSVSAAHLQAASALLTGANSKLMGAGAGLSALYPPGQCGVMSRRHTAVSVCPNAAAHQALNCRRGTYVANPLFGQPAGLSGAQASPFQHRHSAHTVHTLGLLNPGQQQQNRVQQQQTGSRLALANNSDSSAGQQQHQTATESPAVNQLRSTSAGSHQLLPLVYPFKRQSSGGARSTGNFSFDLSAQAQLLAESRRSIH